MIVGWIESSAFSVQEVQSDGLPSPLDTRVAALVAHANEIDTKANQLGAIGIAYVRTKGRPSGFSGGSKFPAAIMAGDWPLLLRQRATLARAARVIQMSPGNLAVISCLGPQEKRRKSFGRGLDIPELQVIVSKLNSCCGAA